MSAPFELAANPTLLAIASAASLVLLVASVLGIPWFVARLPADYFKPDDERAQPSAEPPARVGLRIGRNVLGGILLVLGVAMLVLPGQGVLTIVVALVLMDFPGKRAVQRRVVSRPRVLAALNALRRRAGREPLVLD